MRAERDLRNQVMNDRRVAWAANETRVVDAKLHHDVHHDQMQVIGHDQDVSVVNDHAVAVKETAVSRSAATNSGRGRFRPHRV